MLPGLENWPGPSGVEVCVPLVVVVIPFVVAHLVV